MMGTAHLFGIIYLAGPMRGYPRYNFDAFEDALVDLENLGFEVISPHKMDLELGFNPDQPYGDEFLEGCVKRDVDAIIRSRSVVFLPGWESSIGAMAEYGIARWLNRPCYIYPDLTPLKYPGDENVLEEANRIVHGPRQASYGHPRNDFARTAKIWEAILGSEVKPEQVALCMLGVKISRECNAHKRDNITDMAGYAATLEMLYA